MALGGIAPLLIFSLAPPGIGAAIQGLIPFIPLDVATAVGVPIPIYLHPELTGILVETHSRHVDFDVNAQQTRFASAIVDQRGLNNSLTVTLVGRRDNVLVIALLSCSDILFAMAAAKSCRVSYINGPHIVLNGMMSAFSTSEDAGNDLVRISLGISKATQGGLALLGATIAIATLPKTTAALP